MEGRLLTETGERNLCFGAIGIEKFLDAVQIDAPFLPDLLPVDDAGVEEAAQDIVAAL
jgi:hypothetical protein